jgi:hypothetical protein
LEDFKTFPIISSTHSKEKRMQEDTTIHSYDQTQFLLRERRERAGTGVPSAAWGYVCNPILKYITHYGNVTVIGTGHSKLYEYCNRQSGIPSMALSIMSDGRMTDEWERIWKEAVVT